MSILLTCFDCVTSMHFLCSPFYVAEWKQKQPFYHLCYMIMSNFVFRGFTVTCWFSQIMLMGSQDLSNGSVEFNSMKICLHPLAFPSGRGVWFHCLNKVCMMQYLLRFFLCSSLSSLPARLEDLQSWWITSRNMTVLKSSMPHLSHSHSPSFMQVFTWPVPAGKLHTLWCAFYWGLSHAKLHQVEHWIFVSSSLAHGALMLPIWSCTSCEECLISQQKMEDIGVNYELDIKWDFWSYIAGRVDCEGPNIQSKSWVPVSKL